MTYCCVLSAMCCDAVQCDVMTTSTRRLNAEQQALLLQFLPLANKEASRFAKTAAGQRIGDRDECFQFACVALAEAVLRFREGEGVKFITYATKCLRLQFRIFAKQDRLIYVPPGVQLALFKRQNQGEDGTLKDALKALSVQQIPMMRDKRDEDEASLPDRKRQDNDMTAVKRVRTALMKLRPRDRLIVECSFGVNFREMMTDRELGRLLGLSHQRVQQLKIQVLHRLRELLEADPENCS